MTYYVPLAVGVLLLSLGTDYNLFIVGRIWQESDGRDIGCGDPCRRPPRGPGDLDRRLALAASFATLAIVPDRAVLVVRLRRLRGRADRRVRRADADDPALLAAFGETSRWPGRRRVEPAFASVAPSSRADPEGTDPGRGLSL